MAAPDSSSLPDPSFVAMAIAHVALGLAIASLQRQIAVFQRYIDPEEFPPLRSYDAMVQMVADRFDGALPAWLAEAAATEQEDTKP